MMRRLLVAALALAGAIGLACGGSGGASERDERYCECSRADEAEDGLAHECCSLSSVTMIRVATGLAAARCFPTNATAKSQQSLP